MRPSFTCVAGARAKPASCAAAVAAALLFAPALHAWGPIGHRAVALIAEAHLSPAARQRVRELIGPASLADVSVWADEVREARPETSRWHYVNINLREHAYDPRVHCRPAEAGDCIVAAIERARALVADETGPRDQRVEALKFLVHLVGDLHQPLHCGDNYDRGGNDVEVQWFGQPTNLHALWDSGFTDRMALTETQLAARVQQGLTRERIEQLQQGSVVSWALASQQLARDHAYAFHPSRQLGARYFNRHREVVEEQILRAGLRLARLLEEAP